MPAPSGWGPPEAAAALDRRERAGHVAGANGIHVREDGQSRARRSGSCGRRAEKRDDVGAAARGLVQLGVNSVAAEKIAQGPGGCGFAARAGNQRGIDRINGDQVAQEFLEERLVNHRAHHRGGRSGLDG